MSTKSLSEETLDALGEEFSRKLRRGEKPSIAEFAGRYDDDQAQEVRDFLESIAMLEELKTGEEAKRKTADSIPENFGRYRIERSLGEGGMGAVYLAHDSQLDRKVALKTPKFERNSDPQLMTRFYREARSAATLQHPNICPVYDVGEIDGIHYISMAYIEGRPLSDVIQSKNFPPVLSVIRIVRKIALALHEAHSQGVIHRDLKPANIMIGRRNEPIVMDFGLARQFDSGDSDEPSASVSEGLADAAAKNVEARLTMDGTVVGSPGYMSPEQLRGEHGSIGPASDIYALGVLLYELLTRELPFPGDGSLMSVVNAVLTESPPDASIIRPQIEACVVDVCRKAMAKKAGDRYESMQAFAVALTQILNVNSKVEDDTETSVAANSTETESPELVRTKEQYELAKSLYQEGQYAAAVSILEKMVGTGETQNRYTTWAGKELPKARLKAEKAATADVAELTTGDDFWSDDALDTMASPPVSRGKKRGRKSQSRKKSGRVPMWAYGITCVGLVLLMVVARNFYGNDDSEDKSGLASAVGTNESDGTSSIVAEDSDHDPVENVSEPGTSDPVTAERDRTAESRPERFNPERVPPVERMLRLDVNDDGKVSKEELTSSRLPVGGVLRRAISNFDRFDLPPRDGALDKVEIQRMLKQLTRPADGNTRPRGIRK